LSARCLSDLQPAGGRLLGEKTFCKLHDQVSEQEKKRFLVRLIEFQSMKILTPYPGGQRSKNRAPFLISRSIHFFGKEATGSGGSDGARRKTRAAHQHSASVTYQQASIRTGEGAARWGAVPGVAFGPRAPGGRRAGAKSGVDSATRSSTDPTCREWPHAIHRIGLVHPSAMRGAYGGHVVTFSA